MRSPLVDKVKETSATGDLAPFPLSNPCVVKQGEMECLIQGFDWAGHLLGPREFWPPSLKTAMEILLHSVYPMYIAWGPEFIQLYNDAYRPILGASKHPLALGSSSAKTFSEIWDFVGPLFNRVLNEAYTATCVDQRLVLHRNGFAEECYFSFSYSPILVENGKVGGVFVTVLETTQRVLQDRNQQTLRQLQLLHSKNDLLQLYDAIASILKTHPDDLPFTVLYERPESGDVIRLFETGLTLNPDIFHTAIELNDLQYDGEDGSPDSAVKERLQVISLPHEPIQSAVILPVVLPGVTQPVAYFMAGLNPHRALDQAYQDFLSGITTHIAHLIADATTYALEKKLFLSEETLRLATEATELGTWDLNLQNQELYWSDRCKALFGLPPGAVVTMEDFRKGLHPEDRELTIRIFADAINPEVRGAYDVEYRTISLQDQQERWVSAKGTVIFDDQGRGIRAIGTVRDITHRKRADAHLRLMVDELNHRVKNTLASVQTIAMQTLHSTPEPKAFVEGFTARLISLSQAQNLLTRENWSGAFLEELLKEILKPFHNKITAQFVYSGPKVYLSPKAAISLSMTFHELATNAAKYGCLSISSGRLTVNWSLKNTDAGQVGDSQSRYLWIDWLERGGPPIIEKPIRQGFGSRLIQQGIAYELAGKVHLNYAHEGLHCAIEVPL